MTLWKVIKCSGTFHIDRNVTFACDYFIVVDNWKNGSNEKWNEDRVLMKRGKKQKGTHVVQFVVESAGIAYWLSVLVAPPQGGHGGFTIGTRGAGPSGSTLQAPHGQKTSQSFYSSQLGKMKIGKGRCYKTPDAAREFPRNKLHILMSARKLRTASAR